MAKTFVKITHKRSGELLAEGPVGWGIMQFEGNYYISGKYLKTDRFTTSFIPGFCPYKFLYVWMDYHIDKDLTDNSLGWKYILPNPLFPFIWFRIAVPGHHPSLQIEEYKTEDYQHELETHPKKIKK